MARPRVSEEPTDERLVHAARTLLDQGGIEAVSMRKVAAVAGVTATSVYWHFGGREPLLHRVLDAMIAERRPPTVRGSTPRRRIVSLARALRVDVPRSQPLHQLAQYLGRAAELSFPAQVVLCREMNAAGLVGGEAAEAARAVLYVIGGFILVEDMFRHRQPGSETTQQLWKQIDDPAIDPVLRETMGTEPDTGALFAFTVERLLDSLLP